MSYPTKIPLPRPMLATTNAPQSVAHRAALRTSPSLAPAVGPLSRPRVHLLLLFALWLVLYVAAAFTPPLLDDADATHAQASQAMLSSNDWVTLHVNGIRYLEKPPLPYWITAVSLKLFAPAKPPYGRSAAFAVHFPLALTILGLALLGYAWARRAFNSTAAVFTSLFLLTSTGTFLFTRVFIPDALLSLLLAFTLYAFLRALRDDTHQNALILSEACSNNPAVTLNEARSNNPAVTLSEARTHPSSVILSEARSNNPAVTLSEARSNNPAVILSEARSNNPAVILSEARSAQPKDPNALHRSTTVQSFSPTKLSSSFWPYAMWAALALSVLTKGLIAIVFVFATTFLFLLITRQLHQWRALKPFTGILLFLAIAAPWHILAGLRNTGGANGHGFFWFYFINEHVLRFLGRRIPRDYNKLPGYLYWTLHLVWLFPWSLFAPAALLTAYRNRRTLFSRPTPNPDPVTLFSRPTPNPNPVTLFSRPTPNPNSVILSEAEGPRNLQPLPNTSPLFNRDAFAAESFRQQTIQLLLIFSALVLVFFSVSTNQEYYTFPVYLPLLMLLAAALTSINHITPDPTLRRALTFSFAAYTLLGLTIAAALGYGLYASRHLPFVPDIGELLAHRDVGDYTLSMSHFFDLTGQSFAALRLPAALALIAFLLGPAIAWLLFSRQRLLPAILAVAATSSVFLLAAHIAFIRFNPMLSSVNFARTIQTLERTHQISPNNEVLLFGDQAFGSSIPFYLNRQVDLVDGRSTSMLFGSTFPDAPPIFLTSADLIAHWGTGPRKLLFVPLEKRDEVDHLLGSKQIILQQTSGKALITDRPLASN